jgi:hypothetical protein
LKDYKKRREHETSTSSSLGKKNKLTIGHDVGGWNNLISPELDWETYLDEQLHLNKHSQETNQRHDVEKERKKRMTHFTRPRYLTHREAARLMGFSNKFQIFRQNEPSGPATALFGNAVTPPIIGAICACMLRAQHLKSGKDEKGWEEDQKEGVEEDPEIGSWDCVGARVALKMTLDSIPEWRREALAKRIKALSTIQNVTTAASTTTKVANEKVQEKPNCCFRFRDTGKCSWGDDCKFLHY